ncbi:hypothetical protein HWV62_22389 [Athelia sp. TMB]|nr:hypothetical protein HWV62_22389 [Athelia sp. TMB]
MGQTASSQPASPIVSPPAGCPMHKEEVAAPAPSCPMKQAEAPAKSAGAQCPIDHGAKGLNPLNQMPDLAQQRAPNQQVELPLERTVSSIPRDPSAKWEYPSPQQFYNALVRKGWETPEEHVETMVGIHNFLNEEAWQEVMKWEKRAISDDEDPHLARFKGRPGEMSPKARFMLFAGWLLPSRFNTEPPFDRHDWIVRRPKSGEEVRYVIDYYSAPPEADVRRPKSGEEVRYVIDYYSAPPEADGSPVFSLDVRPALDSFGSLKQRITVATEEVWSSFKNDQTPEAIRRNV